MTRTLARTRRPRARGCTGRRRARARPRRRSPRGARDTRRAGPRTGSRERADRGDVHDEAPAAGDVRPLLGEDLPRVIPREEERVLRRMLLELGVGPHRDVRAGAELPLLDRRRVADELDELARDAAVVRDGRALRRRAVADDALALATRGAQQRDERVTGALDPLPQAGERVVAIEAHRSLALELGRHAR